jgi:hypothetical protein
MKCALCEDNGWMHCAVPVISFTESGQPVQHQNKEMGVNVSFPMCSYHMVVTMEGGLIWFNETNNALICGKALTQLEPFSDEQLRDFIKKAKMQPRKDEEAKAVRFVSNIILKARDFDKKMTELLTSKEVANGKS